MTNTICFAGVSIGFAAVCVDDDKLAAEETSLTRWPYLEHFYMPAESIHKLGICIVPNRLVVDGRSGRTLKWWDGTSGNVLKGRHGRSRTNGSHDLLGELIRML
uniref:Uncharacterized protein n=1 Tax=Octactis speculum TaxID=3111310 RepID=A0A7S2CUR1_9STRA|mmetsp:Transcript_39314/g.53320  ORF Transcript_39314/g.53320 Transcript_39314/m.53320 type:complete len:104 (+) Transcript_39314:128-439(+)